ENVAGGLTFAGELHGSDVMQSRDDVRLVAKMTLCPDGRRILGGQLDPRDLRRDKGNGRVDDDLSPDGAADLFKGFKLTCKWHGHGDHVALSSGGDIAIARDFGAGAVGLKTGGRFGGL